MGFCAICKVEAKQTCSNCKNVYYCSREHQKSDWKNHSKNCLSYRIAKNLKVGRHLVATKNIESGELVLQEKSLLVTLKSMSLPACLNCYVSLTRNNAKPCEKCGWPLCKKCTTHGPECELTMKYRKSKVSISDDYTIRDMIYDAPSVLRVLAMRERDPQKYAKFMNLQALEIPKPLSCVSAVRVINEMGIQDVTNVTEVMKIVGIVGINGFGRDDNSTAIFDKLSFSSHSCLPNSSFIFSDDGSEPNNATADLRAMEKIPKGHEITVSYVNPCYGTAQRRFILHHTKNFYCDCDRCKDPTEFGTMFNAVKCFERSVCTGFMLPKTFLKFDENFICNKCNQEISAGNIELMLDEVYKEYMKVDQKNSKDLERFIEKFKMIIHENHFLNFKVEMALVKIYMQKYVMTTEIPSRQTIKNMMTICKKLDSIMDVIMPSMFNERLIILECLCHAMMAADKSEINNSNLEEITKKLFSISRYIPFMRGPPKTLNIVWCT